MSVNGNISAGGEIRGTVSGPAPIHGSTGGTKVLHTDSYAIAVANGFVGTVDEWLESLKGKDGISPVVAVEDIDGGHRVTITDKDGEKTFDVMDGEDGAVTEEQIASAVEDYMAEHPVECVDAVKTVNGISPDANGNVEIPVSGGNADLTGYATEQWVKNQKYLTEVPEGYAKDEDIPTKPEDIGALPDTYTPPNQTAEQVGADPKGTAASAVSQHNASADSHGDIRLELKAINDKLTAFFDSDNQTLDELSEIVAYITSNKSLIDSITTSKVSVADIINNLTTNVSNKPLSAAQGVVLKGLIDTLSNNLENYQPKGDYALRSELPTVPTKVSAFENDKGYLTQHQDISGKLDASALPTAINTALAQAKASGEFDGEDGSDGFETITENEFAAITQENLAAKYADGVRVLAVSADENLVPTSISQNGVVYNGCGYMNNYRLNSSGGTQEALSAVLTGFMHYTYGKTIEIAGGCNPANAGGQYIATYDSNFALIGVNYLSTLISNSGGDSVCTENNEFIHTVKTSSFGASSNTNLFKTAAYIRVCLCPCVGNRLRVRYI